ncbi:MAG: hypothetical protein IT460_17105 [Planctomycetes bacterium]|nr:hypothetical protein [Planctomycetota bacterium]
MDPLAPDAAPPRRGMSFATLLAALGLAAVLVAWMLPWIHPDSASRERLGLARYSRADIDEQIRREGLEGRAADVARRFALEEMLTGFDLAAAAQLAVDRESSSSSPEERRGFSLFARVGGLLPWGAGLLALALFLGRLRPTGALLGGLVIAFGLVLGGFAGLLLLGMSQSAREETGRLAFELSSGVSVAAIGGAVALLAGFFSPRWGRRWLSVLVAVVLVVGAGFAIAGYVRG